MDDSKLVHKNLSELFIISIVIGVLAGIFSWLFRLLIGFIHNAVFLGQISATYDANVHTPESYLGWLIIFAPVLGGIIVVFLIKNFAPEAKGHGVPEVMYAIYHKRGFIPAKVSLVKALASAITIGTGGSLGREGPIVQISAAFSSFIARLLQLTISQRNLMIACGASSGIAATFNAPLGGILFAIELLLVSVNSQTLLPVAVSTVIAANVGRYLIGSDPAFIIPELLNISNGNNIYVSLLAIPLGGLMGMLSLVFIKSIYWSEDLFDKLPINDYLKHMIGTFLLGLLFYSIYVHTGHYYVQGVGYATIQDVLMNMIADPIFLLSLVFLKLIATSLTIGSGGSGGVFSPSLFLGAVMGAAFGKIAVILFPGVIINPVLFVVSGMAAMVASTTSAPLTAVIIVYEMTLDYNAILPIMMAVSIAYAVRWHFMKEDIYTVKLARRGQIIPSELVVDLKAYLMVDDVVSKNLLFVSGNDTIYGDKGFACVLEDDKVVNVINLNYNHIACKVPVKELKKTNFVVLKTKTTFSEAVMQFHENRCDVALVSTTGTADKASIVGAISSMYLINFLGNANKTLR